MDPSERKWNEFVILVKKKSGNIDINHFFRYCCVCDEILPFVTTWNEWKELCHNANLTLDFVLRHLDKSWDWDSLSKVLKVPNKEIVANITLPWSWKFVMQRQFFCQTPEITIDLLLQHRNICWNWSELSKNPSIHLQDILNHPELPWNFESFSHNKSIQMEDLLQHPELAWNWRTLSMNENLNFFEHLELPWDWTYLSSNQKIKMKDVLEHPDLPWDWNMLSYNFGIQPEDIMDNPQLPWNWKNIICYRFSNYTKELRQFKEAMAIDKREREKEDIIYI